MDPMALGASPFDDQLNGPSTAGYWIGVLFLVLGVLGAIWWGTSHWTSFQDQIDDFERVPVGRLGVIQMEAGDHVVYAERGGGESSGLAVGEVRMRRAGERGSRVSFGPYTSELTYDLGGRSGRAQYTFHLDESGQYQVRVQDVGSATTAAFGPSVAGELVSAIVGALVIGGVGLLLGIIVLVVTGRRRRRFRQRNWMAGAQLPMQPGGFGPPPGTYAPPPPPAGFPAPDLGDLPPPP